jgi:hypothetical protein
LAPSPSVCPTTPGPEGPVPYRAYNPLALNTPFMQEGSTTNSQVALGLLSPSPPSVELYNVNNETLRKKKFRLRSISCPVAKLLVDE